MHDFHIAFSQGEGGKMETSFCPTRSGARPTRARNACLQKYSAAVAHESQRLDVGEAEVAERSGA